MRRVNDIELAIGKVCEAPHVADMINIIASLDVQKLPTFLGFGPANMEFISFTDIK